MQAAFRARSLLAGRKVNLAETPAETLRLSNVVQVEPVGRRLLAASPSPAAQRSGARLVTPPAFMTVDGFCRLVDSLAAPLELHLHGEEEPLQHPRFFDMVAYAAARGLEVTATTRLPGLSASRAEACVRSGLRRLNVLLDGTPSPLQERSLRRLDEAKRKLGAASPEVVLGGAVPAVAAAARFGFSGKPFAGPALSAQQ